eukprot:3929261-Lingulodinium_polyedra.AAC.1
MLGALRRRPAAAAPLLINDVVVRPIRGRPSRPQIGGLSIVPRWSRRVTIALTVGARSPLVPAPMGATVSALAAPQ